MLRAVPYFDETLAETDEDALILRLCDFRSSLRTKDTEQSRPIPTHQFPMTLLNTLPLLPLCDKLFNPQV